MERLEASSDLIRKGADERKALGDVKKIEKGTFLWKQLCIILAQFLESKVPLADNVCIVAELESSVHFLTYGNHVLNNYLAHG